MIFFNISLHFCWKLLSCALVLTWSNMKIAMANFPEWFFCFRLVVDHWALRMYGVLWDAWTGLNSLSFSSTSWYVLQMYIKEAEKKTFNWKSDILLCQWTNYLGCEIFHLAKIHTLWENSEPWFARCCTYMTCQNKESFYIFQYFSNRRSGVYSFSLF